MPRDFRLLVFFMNQFPPSTWVYHYSQFEFFRTFADIHIHGSRCTTGVNDTGGKRKKSSIRKILIILFGHLLVVMLTFTLRCLQPPIVPIICHRCRWFRWCTLTCGYLCELSKKFETVLMEYSGAGGKLIHEKNQRQKSRDIVPLTIVYTFVENNC